MKIKRVELPWQTRIVSRAQHFFGDILPREVFTTPKSRKLVTVLAAEAARREELDRMMLKELGRVNTEATPADNSEDEYFDAGISDEEFEEYLKEIEDAGIN